MEEKIAQLEDRSTLIFGTLLGIHILGAVSVAFLFYFAAIAGGALDIVEFDPPGYHETCILLPLVFPLTLITFITYPRLKGRKWARWLFIVAVSVNIILAVPLIMVSIMALLLFSRLQ